MTTNIVELPKIAKPADARPLTQADLVAAVRDEIHELFAIADADLAWIVEVTLCQLGWGVRRRGSANLGYVGSISGPFNGQNFYVYRPFEGGSNDNDAA